MPYALALDEVNKENKIVGQKAASLSELIRSGLPVPAGFVITTEAFEFFLRFNKLDEKIPGILQNLDFENIEQLKSKSKEIEDLIINADITDSIRRSVKDFYENIGVVKEARLVGGAALDIIRAGRDRVFVCVRSSPVIEDPTISSFAGQFRSFINISGTDRLLEAIKRCWASLYSPKAILYRKKHNIGSKPLMGILIQKMIDSEKAGGIFTADPLTKDRTKAVIEAVWGLGQSLSAGIVTPDKYLVDKQNGSTLEKKISKKSVLLRRDQIGKTIKETVSPDKAIAQVLQDYEISKIWEIGKTIENMNGGLHQDIEWCIERGRPFILQARPVTTLNKESIRQEIFSEQELGSPALTGYPASSGLSSGRVKLIHSTDDLWKIQNSDIVVSTVINPELTSYLNKISCIISDEGGVTSQQATVCREFGIPCIVGTNQATQTLNENREIIADSTLGRIYLKEEQKQELPQPQQQIILQEPQIQTDEYQTATEIRANISFSEEFQKLTGNLDGVGIVNSETLLAENCVNPFFLAKSNPEEFSKLILEKLEKLASTVYPNFICYKSMDIKSDELQASDSGDEETKEQNPILGLRGIRRTLSNPEILKCELDCIKKLYQKGLTNISFLIPFVTDVEEIRSVKSTLDVPVKIGVSIETPASAIDIERFCKEGIDFVSIDSNELTQLILGIDRTNPKTSSLYSEVHPTVLSTIQKVIETCKSFGIKTSISGEGLNTIPEFVEKLIEFGVDSISVDLDSFEKIKSIVSRTERRMLLEKIRKESKSV